MVASGLGGIEKQQILLLGRQGHAPKKEFIFQVSPDVVQ
jgi:hypothetical protein